MQSIKVSNNLVSKVSEKLEEAKINTKKTPTNKQKTHQAEFQQVYETKSESIPEG